MKIVAKQFGLTPAAGKRLIAKGMAAHPVIQDAIEKERSIVVIAGTTNGYVAEEILKLLGQEKHFEKRAFFRGVTLPPARSLTEQGRLPDETEFPGDVVIQSGKWQQGKTIFDALETLKKGDVIIKGANAVSLPSFKPAVYIGHPQSGTIGAALPVIIGKRLRLFVPVGLEKRVSGDLDALARRVNAAGSVGPRMLTLQETGYTEIQALNQLTGSTVDLVAAGGVAGAEGMCWLLAEGTKTQVDAVSLAIDSIKNETPFTL